MKVKKFKNIWTMGLILCGGMLVVLFFAKLIFPEFVVGVAEIPSIVAFGNFIDSHKWAYYLFTFATSFITSYFYNCACLCKRKLDNKEIIIVICSILIMFLIENIAISYYHAISIIIMIVTPTFIGYINKSTNVKQFYMTILAIGVHTFAQILSVEIRGINGMITYPNSATYMILLIDLYIWTFLLYCFANYKKENYKNG